MQGNNILGVEEKEETRARFLLRVMTAQDLPEGLAADRRRRRRQTKTRRTACGIFKKRKKGQAQLLADVDKKRCEVGYM